MIPIKGHEVLLRSFAEIHQRFPDIVCDIIGDGPEFPRLKTLATNLGLNQAVRFHGRRDRHEVAEAMRRSLLFALPSKYEGLGCVYLEAMATAKATIGCRGQGIDEVIEHGVNGWLVPPDGQRELTAALAELAENRLLRHEIGEAARRTVLRDFTTSRQAENLVEIYREFGRGAKKV